MKNKFFNNLKVLSSSVVLALAVSSSAEAVGIKYATDYDLNGVFSAGPDIAQIATDGSYLTSAFVPADNIVVDPSQGYFIETFDAPQGSSPTATQTEFNVPGKSADCAINSADGGGVTVSESQAGVANVRRGSEDSVAAAPRNNDTCYAYTTPGADDNAESAVEIDYTDFLTNINNNPMNPLWDANGVFINYLGFYMGSVDDYNEFVFFRGAQELETIDGADILATLGGVNGGQDDANANVWIELTFSADDSFDMFKIISKGIAGEFDNITIGVTTRPDQPVPAPTGIAILGLGLLGLGVRKRYSK